MNMHANIEHITREITAWPGMTAAPHRFGGVEYNLGGTEVGHIHSNGMVDIPFKSRLRDQLIAEGRALPHHLLKDSGWISFYIRAEADVEQAIWLYRLSYLFNATRGRSRVALNGQLDVAAEAAALPMSVALRATFTQVTGRGQPAL